MKPPERKVAGVWCSEVLAHLSEYVDGELTADQVDGINAHLRGCDWCEAFGAGFSTVVAELRREFQEPEPLGKELRERLWKRLVRAD